MGGCQCAQYSTQQDTDQNARLHSRNPTCCARFGKPQVPNRGPFGASWPAHQFAGLRAGLSRSPRVPTQPPADPGLMCGCGRARVRRPRIRTKEQSPPLPASACPRQCVVCSWPVVAIAEAAILLHVLWLYVNFMRCSCIITIDRIFADHEGVTRGDSRKGCTDPNGEADCEA